MESILRGEATEQVIQGKMITDLDSLPQLPFHKINLSQYNFPLQDNLRCINVLTARGCPYHCAFCSTSNTKLRQRSPEHVQEELLTLKDKYNFNSFMFVDDTLSLRKTRYHQILSNLKNLNVKWRSYGRVNALNRKDLELMADSGCLEVAIGIESGSQYILDMIRKETDVQANIDFSLLCRDVGIKCNAMMMIGLPGEDRNTIAATEAWVRVARPQAFGYNIFLPFPDSPIQQEYESYFKQYITLYPYDWEEAVTKAKSIEKCFVSTPSLSREEILNEYHRNFELFVSLTGFDPRKRGTRNVSN
jgi:radical SAM superfamily enzyme YgiQ (UPF0313 family)